MRKKIIAVALAALLAVVVLAHPGRTDSRGGHTNHSTGEYHFHHGYPEHQHTGGVCPYDYVDKTNEGATTSNRKMSQESKDKLDAYHKEIEAALEKGSPTEKKKTVGEVILAIVSWGVIIVSSWGLLSFLWAALVGSGLYDRIASIFKRK